AGVIARLGGTPVFSEVDESTLNLDPRGLEERLTEKTKAIVPVHLFGKLADMAPILEIARRWGIPVVEDAAQAIGASDDAGRMAGTVGTAGTLSFYPSKNLAALGDAGMVLTNDVQLAESIRRIRTHGGTEEYVHETVGGNFRLDAVQAALLEVKLEYLGEWTRMRRERAASYDELFERSGLVSQGKVQPPKATADHVYHKYVIRTRRRDELREHLASKGIGTAVYYPLPLHLQPCFRELGYGEGSFPVAEAAARETLAIPMYPELTQNQQERVVAEILEFFRG
ncbi:MAG TPA: DegT/DnrJ/EryC1/StrS family aminotransferase, partial [Vicinamibacteria bacterium]|nr:DegT/DnrJ/EryC1/StrS family aminotransferase [Vicinamibacteria bacterium]